MKKLFKTIHFDQSDSHVYDRAAENDEWAISGAFAFHNATPDSLAGKPKQAFTNGFLSLGTFGRSTFTSVAEVSDDDLEELQLTLAKHFHEHYGAPSVYAGKQAANVELEFAQSVCEEQPINTVFTVKRFFDDEEKIREEYRIVTPPQGPVHARVWDIVEDE